MFTSLIRDTTAVLYGIWSFLEPIAGQHPILGPHHCTHGPQDRACWKDGFDINTDYEYKIPDGKLVEYHFTISEAEIAPDGYLTNVTLVNGQFPGPKIEADWGDTIRELPFFFFF